MMRLRKAVFLDRDGTLIKHKSYLNDPDDVALYPRAHQAVNVLRNAGYLIIVISNQSGIGRGYFSESVVRRVHTRLRSLLAARHVYVDGIYVCPHRPDDGCSCRKPRTGLVMKAKQRFNIDLTASFAVGDKESDIRLAKNFHGKGVLVLTGEGKRTIKKIRSLKPDHVSGTLYHAACWIAGRNNPDHCKL